MSESQSGYSYSCVAFSISLVYCGREVCVTIALLVIMLQIIPAALECVVEGREQPQPFVCVCFLKEGSP